jgi:hypothetical protein
MAEKSSLAKIAYICECGRKWVLPSEELKNAGKWKCRCGRTIVVRAGTIYSVEEK